MPGPTRRLPPSPPRKDAQFATENVKDFAGGRGLVLVCVLESRLPSRGMDVRLAAMLDGWATANPEPYVGLHWP